MPTDCIIFNRKSRALARFATEVPVTIQFVTDDAKRRKRRTVPIREWWPEAVRKRLREEKLNQKQIAARIGEEESDVSRTLSLQMPVLEVIIAISDLLAIPYPFIIPETETEALHLAAQRRLIRRDLQLSEILAGVTETKRDDQTSGVEPEHGIRSPKRQRSRRVDARR